MLKAYLLSLIHISFADKTLIINDSDFEKLSADITGSAGIANLFQFQNWEDSYAGDVYKRQLPESVQDSKVIISTWRYRKCREQAKVQYEYYLTQTKKYDQTVHILHDVNKHIKAIEGLYGAEQGNTAGEYAAEIRELLKPLIPVQYTENPILNILLTDKDVYKRQV